MEIPEKTTMGTMIAALRKERGMTQAELADHMGVTDKAVSKWERDLSCPDVASLPRLAEIFGISLDTLMRQKNLSPHSPAGKTVSDVIDLVLKALTLAMGVAVCVLTALGKIGLHNGFALLGLGVAAAGVSLLRR